MPHHFLVLGATGPAGVVFCEKALQRGDRLTLLARSPSKLPESIQKAEHVTIVEGSFTEDALKKAAVDSGASIMVSFAGPAPTAQGTPITDAYKILFPQLIEKRYQRAFVLSTPTYSVPDDKRTVTWTLAIHLFRFFCWGAFQELQGIGDLVTSIPADQLKWTMFRVPYLAEGDVEPVKATYVGSGVDTMRITRLSMAEWIFSEIDKAEWVAKSPLICS